MKLVAVLQMTLEPEWFRLDISQRAALRRELFGILANFEGLDCRWFDADPWSGTGAEFIVCEFSDLKAYWNFWNELREHSVFRQPYARFTRVSLGYERSLTVGLVET